MPRKQRTIEVKVASSSSKEGRRCISIEVAAGLDDLAISDLLSKRKLMPALERSLTKAARATVREYIQEGERILRGSVGKR